MSNFIGIFIIFVYCTIILGFVVEQSEADYKKGTHKLHTIIFISILIYIVLLVITPFFIGYSISELDNE